MGRIGKVGREVVKSLIISGDNFVLSESSTPQVDNRGFQLENGFVFIGNGLSSHISWLSDQNFFCLLNG